MCTVKCVIIKKDAHQLPNVLSIVYIIQEAKLHKTENDLKHNKLEFVLSHYLKYSGLGCIRGLGL